MVGLCVRVSEWDGKYSGQCIFKKGEVGKKVGSVMKYLSDFDIGLIIIVRIEIEKWWKYRDGKVLVKVRDGCKLNFKGQVFSKKKD